MYSSYREVQWRGWFSGLFKLHQVCTADTVRHNGVVLGWFSSRFKLRQVCTADTIRYNEEVCDWFSSTFQLRKVHTYSSYRGVQWRGVRLVFQYI